MAIRPSAHSNEYVLVNVVKSVGNVPTAYTVTDPLAKFYVNEFGEATYPKAVYPLLSSTGAPETDELRTIVSTVVKGTRTYTNTITYSEMRLCPITWVSKCVQGGITLWDESWLVVGSESGTGAAMQVNERYIERYNTDTPSHHNPNQAGAGHTQEYLEGDPVDPLLRRTAPPLYYQTSGNDHKGGGYFMDFGGDPEVAGIAGSNYDASDKGQTPLTPVLWYGHRFFQHVQPNFRGDACIHKTTYWTYAPTEWTAEDGDSAPLLAYRTCAHTVRDRLFDEGYLQDLASGFTLPLPNFQPPSTGVDWTKQWTASSSRFQSDDGTQVAWAISNYAAVILRNSGTDMTMAVVAKLANADQTPSTFTGSAVRAPGTVVISRVLHAGFTGTVTDNTATSIVLFSKTVGPRKRGWTASHYYTVIGSSADVQATITAMYTDGTLDEEPDQSEVPSEVTADTLFPVLTAGSQLTIDPPFDPDPINGESFSYAVHVSSPSGATVVLDPGFGLNGNGKLTRLVLRCVTGANVGLERTVLSYDNDTRIATLSSAFTSPPGATDTFVLEPASTEFETYGLFLPWCPYEADWTAGHANPFPPGFDYPNHYHIPQSYRTSGWPGAGPFGGTGRAYHTGLAFRIHEQLGEEVYVVASDFPGSTLAHSELDNEALSIGWHDPTQQISWSPGESNGCFARLLDELDGAIAAAALEGDTLQCEGIFFAQGESDAALERSANAYGLNLETFKSKLRQALVDRGMATTAAKIPWIQPKIRVLDNWPYADTVNAAIELSAETDRYMRTLEVEDLDIDGVHYTGAGAAVLGDLAFDAWADVKMNTSSAGEVDICNLALANIGDLARVTSIDPPDGSQQAALCARFYPVARDEVLEMRRWSFATWRRTPVAVDTDVTEWRYAFLVPADAITVFAVRAADATTDFFPSSSDRPTSEPFITEVDSSGRSVIRTNVEDVVIHYTRRVTDTRRYSSSFRTSLAWALAAKLAGPLLKGDVGAAEAKRCLQMAAFTGSAAQSADAVQRRPDVNPSAPWIAGR